MNLLPSAPLGATPVRAMTIAGTDSGGGAGVAADLRTFALSGVHGCVAVTAVTVQNSLGVSAVHTIPPEVVAGQIRAVVTDIGVQAMKTGMLANGAIIDAIVDVAAEVGLGRDRAIPLVVDPVCASMHGHQLLAPEAMDTLRDRLIPIATVVTPNLDEVRLITGIDVVDGDTQRQAAVVLHEMGAQWAMVKGGHLRSSPRSADILYDGTEFLEFEHVRIDTPHDHGAGDTLASAMCSALAHGMSVPDAATFAKAWVSESIRWSYPLGKGHGPVNPLWRVAGP
ncbi:hydroxymethylpyrimidine/phosphomethylpyrimidine kinase [Williamsia sp. Leaf354]|uniref:Bifunctional hydroxymethylpyrimidine kinase/phosphomethylpyrimidine kinase n=1 Tax=Williamsia herbipolensis TaxID=1603258 RepID=A0AAU4JZH9_9NOCA|nr:MULTISPECIES: bifunctional hydroxymethylpyrimidine kinase/phosphomethylpyrimidine kinase [Williamsia]KQS00269.1 hydroxymethylpyrimidine/phosphomethylpyrimidine kinase [Williamsia sp. Leaf354]MCX6468384.1 bifunctional hydroxymethylpyrimidine kinase/phosphomethylpyrimidine kinase [Mycobacteriales bacterium]